MYSIPLHTKTTLLYSLLMKKYLIIVVVIMLLAVAKYAYAYALHRNLKQKIGKDISIPFEILLHDSQRVSAWYPSRTYPYEFAALFTAVPNTYQDIDQNILDQLIHYSEQGIPHLCPQNKCTNYRLPRLIATAYYVIKKDIPQTVYYLQLAKTTKDAPIYVDNLLQKLSAM